MSKKRCIVCGRKAKHNIKNGTRFGIDFCGTHFNSFERERVKIAQKELYDDRVEIHKAEIEKMINGQ